MKNRGKKEVKIAMGMGLTPLEMLKVREISRKEYEKKENEVHARAFLTQLAIPLNVLVHDWWPKTAKRRAKPFIEAVLDLNDSWIRGVVTDEELEDLLFEYTGYRMKDLLDFGVTYRTFKVLNFRKGVDHVKGDCPKCGEHLKNYGDINFCYKCGTRVTWEEQSA